MKVKLGVLHPLEEGGDGRENVPWLESQSSSFKMLCL